MKKTSENIPQISVILSEEQTSQIQQLLSNLIQEEIQNRLNRANLSSPYLNKKQACNYLGISNNTLDSWIKQGLPTIKIGKTIRFHANELDNWLHTQH